jgi:hypothetical protein
MFCLIVARRRAHGEIWAAIALMAQVVARAGRPDLPGSNADDLFQPGTSEWKDCGPWSDEQS